jgi:DNA-binding LytR/AlgR family response regulator
MSGAGRVRIVGTDSIALSWGSTIEIVRWMDVISVRSVQNHAEIVTRSRTLKARCSLKAIATALAEFDLVQIRRGVAVNGARVHQLIGRGRHRLFLVLEGGACVPVGREFQRQIRARFSGISL